MDDHPLFEPAWKAPEIARFLDQMGFSAYGITRTDAIKRGICMNCKNPITTTDPAEIHEFTVSAFCPQCMKKAMEAPSDDSQ